MCILGQTLMGKLAAMGVREVQLHEPTLVMWDSSEALAAMFKTAYSADSVSLIYIYCDLTADG